MRKSLPDRMSAWQEDKVGFLNVGQGATRAVSVNSRMSGTSVSPGHARWRVGPRFLLTDVALFGIVAVPHSSALAKAPGGRQMGK